VASSRIEHTQGMIFSADEDVDVGADNETAALNGEQQGRD
jgi:hypothetical protein